MASPLTPQDRRLLTSLTPRRLISLMNLIISVDTTTAHLAGTLARPVPIMLPFDRDFHWLLGHDDNPWY